MLKSASNDDSLHTAVREITIDRLVQQGGYARPYTSWAKELNPTRHKELKYHPLVLELVLQRLTDSFITQYNEFSTGEAKDEAAKLAAIIF